LVDGGVEKDMVRFLSGALGTDIGSRVRPGIENGMRRVTVAVDDGQARDVMEARARLFTNKSGSAV
jgi:hypothetical protein